MPGQHIGEYLQNKGKESMNLSGIFLDTLLDWQRRPFRWRDVQALVLFNGNPINSTADILEGILDQYLH